eukprot:1394277-Amorphochlora_amoeboformis.AAC.2
MATASGPEANMRTNVTIEKPFVYGSAAIALNKAEITGPNTHRWTVYVRGLQNEDLSTYISKVSFQLHESFKDPIRGGRDDVGCLWG